MLATEYKGEEGRMKTFLTSVALAMCLALSACVTINIYFPAAAAEKAADKIIDEVWQLKKEQGTNTDQASEPQQ